MVNTITEEKGRNTEEGDCEGDSLEVMTLVSVFILLNFSVANFLE